MKLNIPRPGDRTCIIGTTGSGKTVAALYHLAIQDWLERPWFVLDFKGDEHIAQIAGSREIDINDPIPSEPGIYIVRPFVDQIKEIDDFLMRIYYAGNCGLWIDEGFDVGKSKSLRRLLVQGRSKKISVVFLVQRPCGFDRSIITEAQFYQLFELGDEDDVKRVREFWKRGVDFEQELPEFNSLWYDRRTKTVVQLGPMPDPQFSLELIRAQLPEDEKPPAFKFF